MRRTARARRRTMELASCFLLVSSLEGCGWRHLLSVASVTWPGGRLCGRWAGRSRAAIRRGVFGSMHGLAGGTLNLVRDRPFGIPVGAGIAIVIDAEALAHLHEREHAAHLDRPELPKPGHHRQRVV